MVTVPRWHHISSMPLWCSVPSFLPLLLNGLRTWLGSRESPSPHGRRLPSQGQCHKQTSLTLPQTGLMFAAGSSPRTNSGGGKGVLMACRICRAISAD